jgi:hypothetical protein
VGPVENRQPLGNSYIMAVGPFSDRYAAGVAIPGSGSIWVQDREGIGGGARCPPLCGAKGGWCMTPSLFLLDETRAWLLRAAEDLAAAAALIAPTGWRFARAIFDAMCSRLPPDARP